MPENEPTKEPADGDAGGPDTVTRYEAPDELVMGKRWDTFFRRIKYLARELCTHALPGAEDSEGHDLYPCSKCMRFVSYVTHMWVEYMMEEADMAGRKAARSDQMVLLTHEASFTPAVAVLDPERSVAYPEYGAL